MSVTGCTAGLGTDPLFLIFTGGEEYEMCLAWQEYPSVSQKVKSALDRVEDGRSLTLSQTESLLGARGYDLAAVVRAADTLRRKRVSLLCGLSPCNDSCDCVRTRTCLWLRMCLLMLLCFGGHDHAALVWAADPLRQKWVIHWCGFALTVNVCVYNAQARVVLVCICVRARVQMCVRVSVF